MDAFLMAALAIAILWHCPPEYKMYVTVKMNFAHCVENIYGCTRQCYQVLTSIHGHIRQKPRPFLKLSRPPIKKFAAA
jgi:hypothetical protein